MALIAACNLVGGQAKLAHKINATRQQMSHWTTGRQGLPTRFALDVESVVGRKVTRYQLLPNIYTRDYIGH